MKEGGQPRETAFQKFRRARIALSASLAFQRQGLAHALGQGLGHALGQGPGPGAGQGAGQGPGQGLGQGLPYQEGEGDEEEVLEEGSEEEDEEEEEEESEERDDREFPLQVPPLRLIYIISLNPHLSAFIYQPLQHHSCINTYIPTTLVH